MDFKIRSKTNLQHQIQELIKNQLQTLLVELDKNELTLAEKIHNIRKMCKKQRALLKLLKPILKKPTQYSELNNFYKEVAKQLANSREAKVMIDMFYLLIKNYNLQKEDFKDIEKSLKKQDNSENFDKKQIKSKLQTTTREIKKAIQNVEYIELSHKDFNDLKKGFKRTYKKARKQMNQAYKKQDIETFHSFRKFAKYHMYQITLLSLNSIFPKSRVKDLQKLTDILGVAHDLTLFENYLIQNKKVLLCAKNLISYIHLEQKKLRTKAYELENKLFKEHLYFSKHTK